MKAVHVPFTGGAPAVQSAIGNHVDAIVLTLPTVMPPITQGLLRGIGLASATRNSAVPDVPTYGEMGFPNVYSGSWVGFFAPAKTPDAVVAKLNTQINAIMKDPEVLAKLKTIGFDPLDQDAGGGVRLLQERGGGLGQDDPRDRVFQRVSQAAQFSSCPAPGSLASWRGLSVNSCAGHPRLLAAISKAWMAGTSPAMTAN